MTQLALQLPSGRPRVETDIYPTRYAAFDNPGSWAVFTPVVDGTVRRCTEEAPRRPRSELSDHLSERAVLSLPMKNEHWEHITDGAYVTVGDYWQGGRNASGRFTVSCHYTEPTKDRTQAGTHFKAETIEEAIKKAEAWLAVTL